MPRLAIFAALDWECRAALRALRAVRRAPIGDVPRWAGALGGAPAWVVQTGIGPARAAAAAAAVDLDDCALVISTGCAGALDPTLQVGELVIASSVQDGAATHPAAAAPRQRALALAAAHGLRAREGALLCSASLLASAAQKRAAAARGAIAVEMEGAPIAAAAARAGVAFLAVRAVLDRADDDLGVLAHVADPATGRVRPLALAGHLLRHPAALAELRALQRGQRAARHSLTRFFTAWSAT